MQPIQGQDEEVEYLNEQQFIDEVFEIAFGADARNRDYTFEDVLLELNKMNTVYGVWLEKTGGE